MEDLNYVTGSKGIVPMSSLAASAERMERSIGKGTVNYHRLADSLLYAAMAENGMLNNEEEHNSRLWDTVKKMLVTLLMESHESKDEEETSTELAASHMRVACELCAWLHLFSKYV